MLKAATKVLIGLSLVVALTGPLTFYEGGWGLLARRAVIQSVLFALAAASPLLSWMGVARTPQSLNERLMAGIAYVLTSYLISVLSQLNSFMGYVDYALQLGLLAGVFVGPRQLRIPLM